MVQIARGRWFCLKAEACGCMVGAIAGQYEEDEADSRPFPVERIEVSAEWDEDGQCARCREIVGEVLAAVPAPVREGREALIKRATHAIERYDQGRSDIDPSALAAEVVRALEDRDAAT